MSDTTLSTSQAAVNFVNAQGRLVAKSLSLPEKLYDNTFTIRIYRDVIIEKTYIEKLPISFKMDFDSGYLKATSGYKSKIDNTLKIGYFTLDAWRISKMLQGQWDDRISNAYLKAVSGEEMDSNELKLFFNNRKALYSGSIKDDILNNELLFHKFLQLPLIPSMIKNTKLEAININMIQQRDDYSVFESCKLTKENSLFLYDEDWVLSKLNSNYINPFTRHTIFSRYFGETI